MYSGILFVTLHDRFWNTEDKLNYFEVLNQITLDTADSLLHGVHPSTQLLLWAARDESVMYCIGRTACSCMTAPWVVTRSYPKSLDTSL